MKIYIKNARILAEGINGQLKHHILIQNGRIEKLSQQAFETAADIEVEAEGCYLSPGWCDMRANFCDPGLEYKEDLESGLQAAAAGGFTAVAVLPNTQPALDSKKGIRYIAMGNAERITRLYPLGAVTVDTKGTELAEILDLHHAGAIGFTDGTHPITDSGLILKALQYLQQFNGLLMNQPVEASLVRGGQMHEGINSTLLGMKGIPSLAEEMAIERDLRLLRYTGGRLHFSCISTAAGVEQIKKAKAEGLEVSCDVAAHQLMFTDNALLDFDSVYKVSPPLRSEVDRQALIAGLKDGTIDAIVSDHQPQDTESKKLEFDLADFGMINLQTLFSGIATLVPELELPLFVEKVAVAPRKLLGLPAVEIKEGAEANLTLFSPNHSWRFKEQNSLSKGVNSPFLNKDLKGKALGIVANGLYQFDEGLAVNRANG